MTLYTVSAVLAAIEPVTNIIGRPSFVSLWDLTKYLVSGLKKLKNVDHPVYGHSSYMMFPEEYTKIFMVSHENAEDIGTCGEILLAAISKNNQRNYCKILHTAIT